MAIKPASDRQQPHPAKPDADASVKMIQEAMEYGLRSHKGPDRKDGGASMTIAQRERAMFANGFDFALSDNHEQLKHYRLPKIDADPLDGTRFNFNGKPYILKSPEKPYNQTLVDEPDSPGRKVLRFEVRGGDYWSRGDAYAVPHDKNRAEISTGQFDQIGDTYDYSFGIKLPSDFPQEKNRVVLAQWWQNEKASPPLSLRFENGQPHFYLNVPPDGKKELQWNVDPNFKPDEAFKLGRWDNFRVQVKWSSGGDGRIDIWLDGKRVLQYDGPTCQPGTRGPVFKAGIYRDNTASTAVAYYRDLDRKRDGN